MARRNWHLLTVLMLAVAWSSPVPVVFGQNPQPVFLAPVGEPDSINSPTLFSSEGIAPGTPAWGGIKADFDFLFLQPIFPGRAVQLQVPSPKGVDVLGGTGDLSNDFAFSPGFEIGYQFKNTGFGVQVQGRMVHLTGKVQRTVHDTAGGSLAEASATSIVDLAVINPLEGFYTFPLSDWTTCEHDFLQDSLFTVTLGSRFAHLQQNYTTTVITGLDHQGSLVAKQSFDGFGVTSSFTGIFPMGEKVALYTHCRGSLLIGDNDRESTITIVTPKLNTGIKATEVITDLIPMAEVELGVMYGMPVNRPGPSPNYASLLWVKGGFVGQAWGNLGLLKINETNGEQFSGTNLFLVGFTIQIGLDY